MQAAKVQAFQATHTVARALCGATALVAGLTVGDSGQAAVITAYSQMPTGNTILFPNPFLEPTTLAAFGITREVWTNATNAWIDIGYQSGATGFYPPNTTSEISPYGGSINNLASRFTFSQPVYAAGATLIATNFPAVDNASDSFDDNIENVSYDIVAYDSEGNIIGQTQSSSYGNIVGSVEYHTNYLGTGFMASFAGLWLEKPMYQLVISGRRLLYGQPLLATIGAFSFSSQPLQPTTVPEPPSISIVVGGLFILSLAGLRGPRRSRDGAPCGSDRVT